MAPRHFPVRPDRKLLEQEAKAMLDSGHATTLPDARLALARSYGLPSWERLVVACRMTHAIWEGDADTVRQLVLADPSLLHEDARGVQGNWGPPMSYAANVGRSEIIAMLRDLGATDLSHAFDRACLRGKLDAARQLYDMGARPARDAVMGPAETLSGPGMKFLFELGAELADAEGDADAPVALVLETYCRNPPGKHECLELFVEWGVTLPDTPVMALHRGRVDLLRDHLQRDPDLLGRTFDHGDIYPRELGCHADESLALHGAPLAGTTLLHLAVDFDEIDIARWLIEQGVDTNVKGRIDESGFGGHTALFGCVVSQPHRVGQRRDDAFAHLLLDNGADPSVRASLRKRLRFVEDETMHEYHDVRPWDFGRQFHDQDWVSEPVMKLLAGDSPSA